MDDVDNVVSNTPINVSSEREYCGIVMPISRIDTCSAEHWKEVKSILTEAIEEAGFHARLVSDANESGVIQKRIVQNLYDDKILVCDVSCKNPNVMFELGMRLAFDKPVIIVMDDKTDYSFDTSIIEHLGYPRDLSYFQILDFKQNLSKKIRSTFEISSQNPDYSTFLKNFGEFKVATIRDKEGTLTEAIIAKIDAIENRLKDIQINNLSRSNVVLSKDSSILKEKVSEKIDEFCENKKISAIDIWMNEKQLSEVVKYINERLEWVKFVPDSELKDLINSTVGPF